MHGPVVCEERRIVLVVPNSDLLIHDFGCHGVPVLVDKTGRQCRLDVKLRGAGRFCRPGTNARRGHGSECRSIAMTGGLRFPGLILMNKVLKNDSLEF